MLDPFIIEEIRRREEAERRDEWRPVLEIPMEMPRPPISDTAPEPLPDEERGVVILDFSI
jgi:hypothetical protein